MEVTSVSPSATSPTEGDDLCEIDVTAVAIHSVTLLISLCGLAGNGAVLCLLCLKVCNAFIFIALLDFLFLLLTVPSALLFLVEDVSCSLIMPLPYITVLLLLPVLLCICVLLILLYVNRALHIDILYKLCSHFDVPLRLSSLELIFRLCASFGLFAVGVTLSFLCFFLKLEHCSAGFISLSVFTLLILVAPIVISHTVNFIMTKRGSREHQPKRRNIVIFILVLFILLLILCNFLQHLGYILLSTQVVFLLSCIQSSIKPFIYFLVGRCWRPCSVGSIRLSLQRVFDEPEENTAHRNDATSQTLV